MFFTFWELIFYFYLADPIVLRTRTSAVLIPNVFFLSRTDEEACLNLTDLKFDWHGEEYNACEWWFDGSGLLYQVVAGPVFNNLYILAGIFTGFLADYGRRTVWLVLSLVFWSLATGCTGFVTAYWQLVLLRALLAIG